MKHSSFAMFVRIFFMILKSAFIIVYMSSFKYFYFTIFKLNINISYI
jgi:hypothetical protein